MAACIFVCLLLFVPLAAVANDAGVATEDPALRTPLRSETELGPGPQSEASAYWLYWLKRRLVRRVERLVTRLQSKAGQVVLIPGEQGPPGEPGAPGAPGPTGQPGESLSADEALAIQDDLLSRQYVQPTQTPQEFYESIDAELRTYQYKLQNLLDLLEEIEVGDACDYTEIPPGDCYEE